MKKPLISILIGLAFFFAMAVAAQAQVIDPDLQTLLDTMGPDDEIDVLVTLSDQVDLKKIKDKNKDKSKKDLRTALITELKDKQDKTQKAVEDFLKGKTIKLTSFWIFNGLAVTATKAVILELANQAGIESIRLDDFLVKSNSTAAGAGASAGPSEWNLDTIRAPELWALGFTGSGVVVASTGTGVDALHQDLASRWRGGANSWFDPNGQHAAPYDYHGHETRVTGLMVAGDAGGTSIGTAPDARWIAAKIFDDAGIADYSDIHAAFQWLLDPDSNPNTNDAPDIVNNSWGYTQLVNTCFGEFRSDIQALKAAEIAVVFSAGNEGPASASSVSPANYPESFAVGAVDDTLQIAPASSRGPSACDGTVYPEVVAPGVDVKTTDLTYDGIFPDRYTYASGTSFAAPHASGALALLLQAFPWASVSELEAALEGSAQDLGAVGSDNDYGNGLIDAMAGYNLLDQGLPQCTDADGDGYYAESNCTTAQDCNDSDASIYPGASEIKHDGVDQDCNGYDLAIDIIKATYETGPDRLSVEATSDLGKNADLTLDGYGAMRWNRKKAKWTLNVNGAGGGPGTVTVSGVEGAATAAVESDSPGSCTDADSDGFFAESACGTEQDCNDNDSSIYPGAPEIPDDGIDQDCDGSDLTGSCTDADGDGFFAEASCGTEPDCNDNDNSIYPGAPEIPDDGIDQDCDGSDLTTACTDADGDGFFAEAGCGTAGDCDDGNAAINPGASEIKHDGIDQDCNGYDLTIEITSAAYDARRDKLSVEATSALGQNADLQLAGYGAMKWNNRQQRWTITVRNAGGNPGTVTVQGVEGLETSPTTAN